MRAKLAGLDTVPPPSKWQLFSHVIDIFPKEHLFADLFVRDVISHQGTELATIAALSDDIGLRGTEQEADEVLFDCDRVMGINLISLPIVCVEGYVKDSPVS